jgi:PleD family two-component response regulator
VGTKFFFTFKVDHPQPNLLLEDIPVVKSLQIRSPSLIHQNSSEFSDKNGTIAKTKVYEEKDFKESARSARENLRILIADDLAFNLDALLIILDACGIDTERQVHKAFDGKQVLKQVKAQSAQLQYNLLLLDCNMPRINGFDTAYYARQYFDNRGFP